MNREEGLKKAAEQYELTVLDNADLHVNYEEDNYDAGARDAIIQFGSKAFVKGAEWADAHPKNPWISVKDKLPEENRKVFFILLFRGIHKEYLAGLYREHKWETERRTYLSPSFDGIVTHWMPIPELNAEPKE